MNRPVLLVIEAFQIVDCFADNIKQSAERFLADRNLDGAAGCLNLHILIKTLGCGKHNAANNIVADMLCNLHNSLFAVVVYFKGIFDFWKSTVELNIDNRSHNLNYFSVTHTFHLSER